MITKDPREISLIVMSYMPMTALFLMISLIYTVYTNTYLIDIITDSYSYSQQASIDSKPTVLLMMHTLTTYSQSIADKFSSFADVGSTPTQRKGIVFGVIIHILLAAFFISTYRVMHTKAGTVPDDWNNETEKELSKAVETEKIVLRNIRRQVRKRKQEEEQALLAAAQRGNQDEGEFKGSSVNIPSITEEENSEDPGRGFSSRLLDQGQGGSSKLQDELDEVKIDIEQPEQAELEAGRLSSDKIHQIAVLSALKRGKKRFCAHCQKFKPERTHHCRQCGECVLKMDHHCPWVGNCVGFYNYKFFMIMLFYGDLLLLFMVATYAQVIGDIIFDPTVSGFVVYIVLVTYILTVLLSLVLTCFFLFHLWLVLNGKTTLEHCEKKPLTKYNFGKLQNFQRVFGRNVILWICPFSPYTEGNGVVFN